MPETVVHFQIRMPPHLHENLASRARLEKTSLNALIVSILQQEDDRSGREVTGEPPGATASR
jgi:predicted HicB family RNase H-like nuclease